MLAAIPSASVLGIDGHIVMVEVHVGHGLPAYGIVGLPDMVGRESKERVRAAILSSGLAWPQQRITVNLAPAIVRKTGAGLEAAIA
jgi:magnesium chelatase family protein